jgi:carbonic anhydrase/acetyltransferase-like protein (isoleucine patch superfamily)
MALIKSVKGKKPILGKDCFVADNATIIGDVEAGEKCSFWFNSVVRGDVHYIKMGNYVNVQDGACIHVTHQTNPTIIGNYVSIAHHAIVHGCTIKDNVLIGMSAIVMDGCVIESNSIVAAGAVLLENTHVESGSIYAGIPAKKVKDIDPERLEGTVKRISNAYPTYASWIDNE